MSTAPPKKKNILARPFLWLGSRPAALWTRIRPERRTLRAISWTTTIAAVTLGSYYGYRNRLGSDLLVLCEYDGPPFVGAQQLWLDIGTGAAGTLVLVIAAWLIFALIVRLGQWLPTVTGRIGTGALIALCILFDESGFSAQEGLAFGAITLVVLAAIFGSLASLTSGQFGEKGMFGKSTVWLFGLLGLAGAGFIGYGVVQEGSLEGLTEIPTYAAQSEPTMLAVTDPGKAGPYTEILNTTYGSGTDLHRPEFGDAAALKTEPVNGKPFAKLPSGHKGKKRTLFWQFGMGEMPINGRVWYPVGDGPFPLVLIVHGNHSMTEYSDTGYQYLGEHLASHGYILCSVDQNFINGNMKKENDARGWLLLEHLKVWQTWNATEGNPFFTKVDMNNIALIGHSRGGEAVTHAALFNHLTYYPDDAAVTLDYGFAIKSIVSIAPVDGQYRPAGKYTRLRDINYFTLHGSHDADVTRFEGDRIYNRLVFSADSNCFKSTLYVYRANHGQWNTVWGPTDSGPPRSLLLNRTALLSGEAQRQIAKVYVTAFLEATLRAKREYLPLFLNPRRGRDWLPDALLISRFEDASFRLIADYEEDADVTTTTAAGGKIRATGLAVYREGDISMRGNQKRYNQGVFLGWNLEPVEAEPVDDPAIVEASAIKSPDASAATSPAYEIQLPDGFMAELKLSGAERLVLHIAEVDAKPKAKDYSVTEANDDDAANDEKDDSDQADAKADDNGDATRPALDFSVVLLSANGTASLPLSRFGMLPPPLKAVTKRFSYIGRSRDKTEITLQAFSLPLAEFKAAKADLDLSTVTGIRLVFDRQPKGVVVIDRIGIADQPK